MITIKENYLTRVQLAQAQDLHGIHADMEADHRLHSTDKDEIADAIKARFGELNAEAQPPAEQKPRWANRTEILARLPRGCKHLITILIFAVVAVKVATAQAVAAPSLVRMRVVPTANSETALLGRRLAATLACFVPAPAELYRHAGVATNGQPPELIPNTHSGIGQRLAALSMVESGDNDQAIGRAGEVSRFQILPNVWARYFFTSPPLHFPLSQRERAGVRESATNAFTAWHIAYAIMQDRCSAFETKFHRPPTDREFYILWARPRCLMGPFPGSSNRQLSPIGGHLAARAQRFANLVSIRSTPSTH